MRLILASVLACLTAVAGCHGGCHGNADCPSHQTCDPPVPSPSCGAPIVCSSTCSMNTDCKSPLAPICVSTQGACCTGLTRSCGQACTPETCPVGEVCMDSGSCAPLQCAAGYTCPAGTDCKTGTAGSDAHGCLRRPCTTDSQCSGGACVNDLCYASAGTCAAPVVQPL